MPSIKQQFGASTPISITLAGLANAAARESALVDNSSDLYLDALVQLKIKLAAGTPSGQYVYVYAAGSEDGATLTDNATGSDAAITIRTPSTNLVLVGTILCPTGATTYISSPISIASAFGGRMPRAWSIVVENKTAVAFDASEANFSKSFSGLHLQAV